MDVEGSIRTTADNADNDITRDKTPGWAKGLKLVGVYYEGYTDNLQQLLNKHSSSTITTYGVRRSHSCKHSAGRPSLKAYESGDNKENDVEIQVRLL